MTADVKRDLGGMAGVDVTSGRYTYTPRTSRMYEIRIGYSGDSAFFYLPAENELERVQQLRGHQLDPDLSQRSIN